MDVAGHRPSASPSSGTLPYDLFLSRLGVGSFHYQLLFVCGIGFSAAAVEIMLTAFLMPELRREWAPVDEYRLGLLSSASGWGSIVGELVCGPLADRYGRKIVFTATVIITFIGGMLAALSPGIWCLAGARAIVGIGYGGNISVDFAMFSEFLPTAHRGWLMLAMACFWPLGQLLTTLLAWAVIPSLGWRWFLAACTLPSLFTAFLRPLFPESPRWLLTHGLDQDATAICRQVALQCGANLEALGLFEGVTVSLENERTALLGGSESKRQPLLFSDSFLKLFSPGLRRTTCGCIATGVTLSICGYGILTLMPSFLEMKGIQQGHIYQAMVLSALSQFPGILCSVQMSKFLGRVTLIPTMLFMTSVVLAVFAFSTTNAMAMVMSCFGSFFLEACWALYHVYVPEVFPTDLRATAIGATAAISSFLCLGVPMVAAFLLERRNVFQVVMCFAAASLVGCTCSGCLLHVETDGRDLQDRVGHGSDGKEHSVP